MALCRCIQQHGWPIGRTAEYIGYVLPVGYPETALICGRSDNEGVIWLNNVEVSSYEKGQRIFNGPNNFTRMKADNNGVTTGRNGR